MVRPLLKLLDIECTGLENFEALMGLTNIAGMSESARKRIIKEKGLPLIEHYMFEFHEMIRRAAVQVLFLLVYMYNTYLANSCNEYPLKLYVCVIYIKCFCRKSFLLYSIKNTIGIRLENICNGQ